MIAIKEYMKKNYKGVNRNINSIFLLDTGKNLIKTKCYIKPICRNKFKIFFKFKNYTISVFATKYILSLFIKSNTNIKYLFEWLTIYIKTSKKIYCLKKEPVRIKHYKYKYKCLIKDGEVHEL